MLRPSAEKTYQAFGYKPSTTNLHRMGSNTLPATVTETAPPAGASTATTTTTSAPSGPPTRPTVDAA